MIMKTQLALICLFLLSIHAQAQLTDNFTDGDFTTNPTWVGDVTEFQINVSNELQSNGPAATASLHLSTANTQFENTIWEFWVKLDFSPSTSNFARIYLMSNQADLENDLNGYYIRIGESGSSDGIDFYKQEGATTTKLIDGSNAVLSASANNQARIRVTRDATGNWTLEADATGGTTFVAEGSVFDNAITSTSFFGVVCNHTSSRNDLFFFDDFEVKSASTVISLNNATAISNTQVDVQFSEDVDPTTAQTTSNYSLDNGLGNPQSAQVDGTDGSLVHLTFNSLPTGSYELTVNNIHALGGGSTIDANSTASFSYTAPIAFKSLVINEIFADFSPQIGLPNAEYIEIHNPTPNTINLLNASFSDGSSTATFPNVAIAANAYLIVCPVSSITDFQPFGNVIGLSSFPSLNNAGDHLTLKDALGNLIDQVAYETSWYNDAVKDDGGFSLELINPTDTCKAIEANWTASNNAIGGTPGTQNSVFDNSGNQNPPAIQQVMVEDANTISIQFDSRMNASSLANAGYLISDGNNSYTVQSVVISANETEMTLMVETLLIGSVFTLQISNALGCNQEALPNTSYEFFFGATPTFHELIITEIMADPNPIVGLPDAEYIEIYNTTNKYISLDQLTLTDQTSTTNFPNAVIAPNSYLLLADTDDIATFSTNNKLGIDGFPALTNDGEPLILKVGNNLIFEITYSIDWFLDETKRGGGFSLEMIDLSVPCLEETNWQGATSLNGGTPGSSNSATGVVTDNFPPNLLRAVPQSSTEILLIFDEKLDSESTQNATISIDNGISISAREFIIPNTKEITLNLVSSLAEITTYTLTISNLQDCSGNLMTTNQTATFQLPQAAEVGDILINEVVPDAFTGGARYVELYNNSIKYISLKDWQLGVENAEGTVGTSSGQRAILASEEWILAPNEYLVFTDDVLAIKNDYPSGQHDRVLAVANSSFITLDAGDEDKQKILLIDPSGNEMDRLELSEDMYFDLLDDINGVALERISLNDPTNDINNWASAAQNVGYGTPGYLNSQNIDNPKANLGSDCFEVTPEVFSPDNDGFDDVLTVHYTCNQNNLVATIIIYDSNGREIKRLTQNQLLSTEGFITWNGVGDNGEKARVGYYILFVETFGLNGNVERVKKTFAVGAKF